ncbi:MAG: hypothetical protein HFG80_10620 [Eubacterium sp.]|nr:hypothetical protein [Eubacterium sp.]
MGKDRGMKIPKYIEKLIEKRAGLAALLNHADYKLAEWLKKNGVEVEEYDIYGGCEMYVNPWDSAKRVKKAIEDK